MSEHERLNRLVAKLKDPNSPAEAGVRVLEAPDKAGLIAAILQEADETVLARLVSFENESGQTLGLEIANRRILRFIQLPPEGDEGADITIVDQPIANADSGEARQLAELLEGFLESQGSLRVRSTKMHRDADPSEIGCSPQALAAAWNIGTSGQSSALKAFLTFARDNASAWVLADDDEDLQCSGDAGDVERLTQLCQADLDKMQHSLDQCLQRPTAPRCVVLGGEQIDAQPVILLQANETRACFLVIKDKLPAVLAAWVPRK